MCVFGAINGYIKDSELYNSQGSFINLQGSAFESEPQQIHRLEAYAVALQDSALGSSTLLGLQLFSSVRQLCHSALPISCILWMAQDTMSQARKIAKQIQALQ